MLTDYHVHLRPDEDGHAAGAVLHRRQRRPLPRCRRRGRDRRARHLRAHPPVRAGARDLAPSVLGRAGGRRPRRLLRVPRRRRSQGRDRGRLRRRRRGADRGGAGGAAVRLRDRLGPLRRRARRSTRTAGTSGRRRGTIPTGSGRATSSSSPPPPAPGLYDILAHPDLVKVWGAGRPGPERDPRNYWEPAVEAIAAAGVAVEVSTAGLRKPVGEIYPAAGFARLCVEAGVPFTLSSDAHVPEQVGYAYDEAVGFMTGLGIERICVFAGRERTHGAARMSAGSASATTATGSSPGAPLIIGGVEIEFDRGLDGHSDADVLAHAVTDAVLGAAGAGDIGSHFPPTDERWRDADSIELLADRRRPGSTGRVVNVDATVICERPPIGPHRERDRGAARRRRRRTGLGQGDDERGPRRDRPGGGDRGDRGRLLRARSTPRRARQRIGSRSVVAGAMKSIMGHGRRGRPQGQGRAARQPRRSAVQPQGPDRGRDRQADGPERAARRRPGACAAGARPRPPGSSPRPPGGPTTSR